MIRQLLRAVIGTADEYIEDLHDEIVELLDENARLVGKLADRTAECQSLHLAIAAKEAENETLRQDFSDLVVDRFSA